MSNKKIFVAKQATILKLIFIASISILALFGNDKHEILMENLSFYALIFIIIIIPFLPFLFLPSRLIISDIFVIIHYPFTSLKKNKFFLISTISKLKFKNFTYHTELFLYIKNNDRVSCIKFNIIGFSNSTLKKFTNKLKEHSQSNLEYSELK